MKKVSVIILLVALLMAINASFTRPVLAADKIILMMAGSLPAPHSASKAVIRFVNAVKKDTNDQVEIRFFPGSELYSDKDIPTAITQGACDMALTNFGTWAGVCPSIIALDLTSGVYRDFKHYNAAQDGPLGKLLSEDLAAKGVHLLGFAALGETQCIAVRNKLVQKPSDLKGLLIRAPQLAAQWFMESLGATPTFASSAELYSALQRGTVDGAVSTAHSVRQSRWYEPCPNITWVVISSGAPFGIVANLDKWNKLPPKVREIITKDWAHELDGNRREASQQQVDAWEFFNKDPKIKTHKVSDEVRKRDWDPVTYEFQLKKLNNLLGKEKTEKILKVIAEAK